MNDYLFYWKNSFKWNAFNFNQLKTSDEVVVNHLLIFNTAKVYYIHSYHKYIFYICIYIYIL